MLRIVYPGVPWLLNRLGLKIQCCHWWGKDSIPGLGTSACCGNGLKKKKKKKKNCVSIAMCGYCGEIIPANKISETVMLSNDQAKIQ